MYVSDEFLDFCSGLLQDFTRHVPEPQDSINEALQFVGKERLPIFGDYLDGLLSANYSDVQLQEMFRGTGSDTSFLDVRYPRQFLGMVRDTIDSILQ